MYAYLVQCRGLETQSEAESRVSWNAKSPEHRLHIIPHRMERHNSDHRETYPFGRHDVSFSLVLGIWTKVVDET